MPRPAKVQVETILAVLKELQIFDESGILKKKKDPVWETAIERLPGMHLHNLYLSVQQDRREIKTILMRHFGLQGPAAKPKKKYYKKEPNHRHNEVWDDPDYYETLDADNDPDTLTDFDTLLTIKDSDQYHNTIKKIGVFPFSVIYWHPHQIFLWSDLIHVEQTVSLIVLNNIILNIKGNFSSGNIFLYALALKLDNTIMLLGEMMSDSVNSLDVQYFLDTWLQGGAPAPPVFVTGYSYSLLDAASLSFNFCSFDQYNLRCYSHLMDDNVELPPTLLQIDIVSLIKVVNAWPCFENVTQSIKDLYLCSIMYISTLDKLDDFEDTIITVLALCQSPYQNEDIELRRISLWAQLTSEIIQQMNNEYIQLVTGKSGQRSFSFYNIRQNPVISESPHEIYEHINRLKQQAFDLCNFSTEGAQIDNDYYCPIILENLIQLLIEFPSWTKIIVNKKECSSLVSTCAVKHLNTLIELKEPVSPPQFLIYHYEKLNSLMHQGRLYINRLKKIGFTELERKNHHGHLIQIFSKESTYDSGIDRDSSDEANDKIKEVNERIEEQNVQSTKVNEKNDHTSYAENPNTLNTETDTIVKSELNLIEFKSIINTSIGSLADFMEYINNILMPQLKPGEEVAVCKTLLNCCTEMTFYDKFIGMIAEKLSFCSNFSEAFKLLFEECYATVDALNKNELKNASILFAHILEKDIIPWESLSIVKLNEKDITTSKMNFLKIIFRELSDNLGTTILEEKLKNIKENVTTCKGLFPDDTKRNVAFASNFYKSIGLKGLGDALRVKKIRKEKETEIKREEKLSKRKRSLSVSSVGSDDSCDYVFEIRIKK